MVMPALRIFDPYAFLSGKERPAAPAKVANPAKAGRAEPGTLATLAALAGARPKTETLANRDPVREERSASAELAPLLLPDGRRLRRFRADVIPSVRGDAAALLDQARRHGAVLVADGGELIVVERWQSALSPKTLQAVKSCAGGIIAVLRGESRHRCAGPECGRQD
jgi:hypothetical protein